MLNNRMWFSRTDFNSFLPFSLKRPIDRILCEPFWTNKCLWIFSCVASSNVKWNRKLRVSCCLPSPRARCKYVRWMDLPSFQCRWIVDIDRLFIKVHSRQAIWRTGKNGNFEHKSPRPLIDLSTCFRFDQFEILPGSGKVFCFIPVDEHPKF